ncbi:hypothetical protein PSM7751_02274 [Pseudooceanicola marinus]|uniref:DUF2207 domain-containing protein n=1 Tax=Pseudooceanicola marinus TaxID=396013 RepID=A0A1X6ZF30_9RHOB|nr:DUF2207 domain-containing protein [Pseudooceanicola marinus]PJE28327.1 DUF2207 domain-containing protein [Pseudooceanicola marinus]SLN47898.1 hypothetical protein PSM7751_02274 [Pseudooceanicola marinus]
MLFPFRTLSALLLILLSAASLHADERIRSFISEITIDDAGGLQVIETLDVQAEGQRIRHGIFRDLPLTKDGIRWGGFDLVEATMDGAPVDTRIQRRDGMIRIYLGDEDTVVSPGEHRFRLRYDVERQVRFLDDHDELYWNVTGNAWAFRIDRAAARISLPDGAVATEVETFTGPLGSREQDAFEQIEDGGGTVYVMADGALDWHEGLTTAIAFPTGIVTRPSVIDRILFTFRDRPADMIALFGTLLLGAALWLIWRRKGKDAPLGRIRLRSTPPEGISPALAQYIRANGGVTNSAMVAATINLGVKGFVVISQNDTTWSVTRTGKTNDGTLPVGEAAILTYLDELEEPLVISPDNRKAVLALLDVFSAVMRDEHGETFHISHANWIFLAGVGGYGLAFAIMWQALAGQTWLLHIMPALPLAIPLLTALVGGTLRDVALMLGIALGISCLMWLIFGALAGALGLLSGAGLIALPVIFAVFAARIGLTTATGRAHKIEIEGFRRYLSAARLKGRSRRNARRRFEAFLPYAIALGVEKQFAGAYEDALTRAMSRGRVPTHVWMPPWYHGTNMNGGSFGGGISAACQAMTSGVNACTTSGSGSGSSGFSGGGFSGGGGGGGGGGGW